MNLYGKNSNNNEKMVQIYHCGASSAMKKKSTKRSYNFLLRNGNVLPARPILMIPIMLECHSNRFRRLKVCVLINMICIWNNVVL